MTTLTKPISSIIDDIVARNRRIADFWSRAQGWAPFEAADLLSKSRLDWQVSLSCSLHMWFSEATTDVNAPDTDGRLILAWANLGTLVEGTLKWFLSVYYESYRVEINAIRRKGVVQDPDEVMLRDLRPFFRKSIWSAQDDYDSWLEHVQYRRNAIHAYKTRDIGTFEELEDDVRRYLEFLEYLDSRVPYPD